MADLNPWVVQDGKVKHEPLPAGFYTGLFRGVSEVKMPDGCMKWRFTWEVAAGPGKGKEASALTDQTISPTTLPGKLIAGLLDRPLVGGENVKAAVDGCIGRTYLVAVQPGPKGGKPGVKTCGKPPAM